MSYSRSAFSALNQDIPPASIPGFDDISRYWDQERSVIAVKLLPGEYYVTREDELITTVLGSCISACICDKVVGIGGMNHFMLPETSEERLHNGDEAIVGIATRYGNYAMEHLINTILKYGGQRQRLEVKLFGGGKIIPAMTNIGLRNIGFVLDYIDTEQLNLVSQDLGDVYPRKIIYYPKTGKAMMKKLKELRNDTIVKREIEYCKHIKEEPIEGDIELF